MKTRKLWVILLASLFVVAWFTYTPADVRLPWNLKTRLINEILGDPHTWTGQQTFEDIVIGSNSVGTVTAITADTVLTSSDATGTYESNQTSAVHVALPTPIAGVPYEFWRRNTGGVSVFVNTGSIGKSGTTIYSHASTDTDAGIRLVAISGVSYVVTVLSGSWSVK